MSFTSVCQDDFDPTSRHYHQEMLSLSLLSLSRVSRVRLCDPVGFNPAGSSVHGISQARTLEWVAISFSRGSSWPWDWTMSPTLGEGFFTTEPPKKPTNRRPTLKHQREGVEKRKIFFGWKKGGEMNSLGWWSVWRQPGWLGGAGGQGRREGECSGTRTGLFFVKASRSEDVTGEGSMFLPLKNSFRQTHREKGWCGLCFGFFSSHFEIVKLLRSGIFFDWRGLPSREA